LLARLAAALGAFGTISAGFASLLGDTAAAQCGETGTETTIATASSLLLLLRWLIVLLHLGLLLVLLRATVLWLAIGLRRILLGRVASVLRLSSAVVLLVRHRGNQMLAFDVRKEEEWNR